MTWQSIVLGSAFPAVILCVLLAIADLPSGRHARVTGTSGPRIRLAVPLVALAFAIGCYVASEVGVSDWLVQFLATASIGLATSALALFWGCLALGRLVSAKVSDRFDHARLAAIASLTAAGLATTGLWADIAPATIRDASFALYFTLAFGVGSLWTALYGAIIDWLGEPTGLPVVFWLMAISFVLAALAVIPIREPARTARDPDLVIPD